jgi:hypothetical protein
MHDDPLDPEFVEEQGEEPGAVVGAWGTAARGRLQPDPGRSGATTDPHDDNGFTTSSQDQEPAPRG